MDPKITLGMKVAVSLKDYLQNTDFFQTLLLSTGRNPEKVASTKHIWKSLLRQ